jgi:hypothetical protein
MEKTLGLVAYTCHPSDGESIKKVSIYKITIAKELKVWLKQWNTCLASVKL